MILWLLFGVAVVVNLVLLVGLYRYRVRLLQAIPWGLFKWGIDFCRRVFFTREWPDRDGIYVEASPEEIEHWLRDEAGFEGVKFAYKYKHEKFNLRKPWGLDSEGNQLELHPRGREKRSGTFIICHRELSRYESKGGHINGEGLSWSAGKQAMIEVLSDSPFQYWGEL